MKIAFLVSGATKPIETDAGRTYEAQLGTMECRSRRVRIGHRPTGKQGRTRRLQATAATEAFGEIEAPRSGGRS